MVGDVESEGEDTAKQTYSGSKAGRCMTVCTLKK